VLLKANNAAESTEARPSLANALSARLVAWSGSPRTLSSGTGAWLSCSGSWVAGRVSRHSSHHHNSWGPSPPCLGCHASSFEPSPRRPSPGLAVWLPERLPEMPRHCCPADVEEVGFESRPVPLANGGLSLALLGNLWLRACLTSGHASPGRGCSTPTSRRPVSSAPGRPRQL